MLQEEEEHVGRENEEERNERLKKMSQAEEERQDPELEVPTVGMAMFEWVNTPGDIMLRKQIPRQEWKTKWGGFAPWQRRYYSAVDEWDLEQGEEEILV